MALQTLLAPFAPSRSALLTELFLLNGDVAIRRIATSDTSFVPRAVTVQFLNELRGSDTFAADVHGWIWEDLCLSSHSISPYKWLPVHAVPPRDDVLSGALACAVLLRVSGTPESWRDVSHFFNVVHGVVASALTLGVSTRQSASALLSWHLGTRQVRWASDDLALWLGLLVFVGLRGEPQGVDLDSICKLALENAQTGQSELEPYHGHRDGLWPHWLTELADASPLRDVASFSKLVDILAPRQ